MNENLSRKEIEKRFKDEVLQTFEKLFSGITMSDEVHATAYTLKKIINKEFIGGYKKLIIDTMTGLETLQDSKGIDVLLDIATTVVAFRRATDLLESSAKKAALLSKKENELEEFNDALESINTGDEPYIIMVAGAEKDGVLETKATVNKNTPKEKIDEIKKLLHKITDRLIETKGTDAKKKVTLIYVDLEDIDLDDETKLPN